MEIRKSMICSTLLLILIFITSCNPTPNQSTIYTIDDSGNLLLDKEGTIPSDQCSQRDLTNQIIVLESKYCGACQAALPKIKEAAEKTGVTVTYLDLSNDADNDRMEQLGVLPYYTPTMIVGCNVYVGGKSQEEYESIFDHFLGEK